MTKTQTAMKKTDSEVRNYRHLTHFDIAGFTYWEGCLVFDSLHIGTRLELVGEPDNRFDPYAVALHFDGHKLGYVPRTENRMLSKFLEMGYGTLFDARIQRLSPDEGPEHQVGVIVYLKRREE